MSGDLIFMFKIVKGIDDINWKRSLDFNASKTRGHEYRLSRENFSAKTIRQNFFLNREQSYFSSRNHSIT